MLPNCQALFNSFLFKGKCLWQSESADSSLGSCYYVASHADGLTDAVTEVPWVTGL